MRSPPPYPKCPLCRTWICGNTLYRYGPQAAYLISFLILNAQTKGITKYGHLTDKRALLALRE
jgi:hypothetical protein